METEKKTFDHKQYYLENKEKIVSQIIDAQKKSRIRNLVKKLNNNEFKRIPYSKIEKYNIVYDEETKKYHAPK